MKQQNHKLNNGLRTKNGENWHYHVKNSYLLLTLEVSIEFWKLIKAQNETNKVRW